MKFPFVIIFTFLFIFFSCGENNPEKEKKTRRTLQEIQKEKNISFQALLEALDDLKADPCLKGAQLGYLIIDCTEKDPLVVAENNPKRLLIPASTLKLFVTGPALEILGDDIIKEVMITNQMSVNWRSSKMLRKIGGKVYQKATTTAGARAILQFWNDKGLDTRGMNFYDGNGLSRNNAVSPKQLVDALYIMQRSPYFRQFYESLPLAGMSGTLHKAMKGTSAQGRVRAKTGTISKVKSFAGYVHTVSGQRLIFSLIINNFNCRTRLMKNKLEAILVKMAEI
jgi:D-alanyl-D-alanine carboxypeptidase